MVLLTVVTPTVESAATKCSDTCSSDADCPADSECAAVGHPDDPGTKHCLCKDGFYGDPFVDAGADVPRCRGYKMSTSNSYFDGFEKEYLVEHSVVDQRFPGLFQMRPKSNCNDKRWRLNRNVEWRN